MTTFTEWINANYGLIVFLAIVIVIIAYRSYKKFKDTRTQSESNSYVDTSEFETELFEDVGTGNSVSSFKKQKLVAEKNIIQIRKEAKQTVAEEKKLDYEFRQKKMQFANEKKRLGLSYTNYMHQSRIIDEMIQNQLRMQEEFKKTKDGNR